MLRIRLLSGAIVAEFHPDELHRMSSEKPVRALKQYLAAQIGCSRFRQRLLREDIELEDDALLTLPSDLQLVILDFQDQDIRLEMKRAFISACANGRVEEVEAMLCFPHDPNTRDPESHEPVILCAARMGYLAVVRLLLEAGADQDAAEEEGWTALHYASGNLHLEVVRELLAAKAHMDAGTQEGWRPLHLASYFGRRPVVEELLSAGADKDAATGRGQTALHMACENGCLEVVRELLAAGADMDATTNRGLTAWKLADLMGHQDVIQFLDCC